MSYNDASNELSWDAAAFAARGQPVTDDSFVLCSNARHEPIDFHLPPEQFSAAWTPVIDTAAKTQPPDNAGAALRSGAVVHVGARSLAVFISGRVGSSS